MNILSQINNKGFENAYHFYRMERQNNDCYLLSHICTPHRHYEHSVECWMCRLVGHQQLP